MSKEPNSIQLRFLQTLVEVSHENNQTIVFPLPINLIKSLFGKDHPSLETKTEEKNEKEKVEEKVDINLKNSFNVTELIEL
jgi:hypothetical protein